jgi:acetyltransferase-like isoleucine patch superfamily enzyme
VIYRAQICNDVRVGDECVIGGFVGERSVIGRKCRIFGKLVHLQHEPHKGWDDDDVAEPSPRVEDGAFIGFNAIVAGGITIGERAYVCAGAIVTKDVPDRHVASGKNRIAHFSRWKGPLKDSEFFIERTS